MTLSIEKRNYSSNPWRLIYNGQEVYRTELFDHPDLGKQTVQMPICANTKTECTELAFKWFEERMQDAKTTIKNLAKQLRTMELQVERLECELNPSPGMLLPEEPPTYTINRSKAKPTALERVERLANDPMYRLLDWDDNGAPGLTEETFAFAKRVADVLDKSGIVVDHVAPSWMEIQFDVGLSEIKVWGCPMPDESPTPNPPPYTINRDDNQQHH